MAGSAGHASSEHNGFTSPAGPGHRVSTKNSNKKLSKKNKKKRQQEDLLGIGSQFSS